MYTPRFFWPNIQIESDDTWPHSHKGRCLSGGSGGPDDSHHCGLCLVRGPPGRPGGVPGPTGGTRRLELRVDPRENLHASLICNGGGVARYGTVMPTLES